MENLTMASASVNNKQNLIGLWAGIIGPLLFTGIYTLDGLFQPGYSPIAQPISYLSVVENGWIQIVDFVIMGLLLILFAFSFSRCIRTLIAPRWLLTSTSLLVLVGIGLFNEAVFSVAAPGESSTAFHVVMHGIGFEVIFSSLALASIILGVQFTKNRAWRSIGWYSIITGVVSLFPVFFIVLFPSTGAHHEALGGLFERIFANISLAWYIVMGIRMLILARKEER